MALSSQRKLIIILGIMLLAVIVVSSAILFLLPEEGSQPLNPSAIPQTTRSDGFNTGVLQRSSYTLLNTTLIENGFLPVRPPATTGKANPFL